MKVEGGENLQWKTVGDETSKVENKNRRENVSENGEKLEIRHLSSTVAARTRG